MIKSLIEQRDEMMRIARLFDPKQATNYWAQQDELHNRRKYVARARQYNHDILRMRKEISKC